MFGVTDASTAPLSTPSRSFHRTSSLRPPLCGRTLIQSPTFLPTFDIVLEKNGTPDQQFVLLAPTGTVTVGSVNVANIFVGQQDRDRYRFGVAYGLVALIKKFTASKW
jgi:hypothetical protein